MSDTITIQVAQRGLVTLPKALREKYRIREGAQLILLDLGGVFVISPRRSEIDGLADQLSAALIEKGESLESMLAALREARQRIEFAHTTRHAAETGYRLARVAEEHGLATQIELNESSVQLEQARLLVLSSIFDYLSVVFDWQRATGG